MIRRIHFLITILLVAFLFSCKGQNNQTNEPNKSEIISVLDTAEINPGSFQYYFPMAEIIDSLLYLGEDTFVNNWYSHHLFSMKEPIIYNDSSQKEIYRFTWLRTFNPPIAIRIEKYNDSYIIFWKMSDGAGGYEPGKLIINKKKRISEDIWNVFLYYVAQAAFWDMPANETELLGNDGSQWILEGKTLNNYHVVDRWTPSPKSSFYKCCDFLIQQTDLEISGNNKY